jgi:hypothetical protein
MCRRHGHGLQQIKQQLGYRMTEQDEVALPGGHRYESFPG